MNEDPVDRLLSGLEAPAPSDVLRARVLAAARGELVRHAPPDPWTRLTRSRPLRLAWAASVLLLLGGHLLVAARDVAEAVDAPRPGRDSEVEVLARLPRIDERALASVGPGALVESSSVPVPPVKKGAAS